MLNSAFCPEFGNLNRAGEIRTAARQCRLLAVLYILGRRVYWLTMLNRTKPNLGVFQVLAEPAGGILDRLVPDSACHSLPSEKLSRHLVLSPGFVAISDAQRSHRRATLSRAVFSVGRATRPSAAHCKSRCLANQREENGYVLVDGARGRKAPVDRTLLLANRLPAGQWASKGRKAGIRQHAVQEALSATIREGFRPGTTDRKSDCSSV